MSNGDLDDAKLVAKGELATTADLEKLMLLLREYTQKLRSMCEERATMQYRRFQMQAMLLATMTIMASALTYVALGSIKLNTIDDPIRFLAIIPLVLAAIFLSNLLLNRRYPFFFSEAEQVAATVERLVKLASQYAEHSSLRIADRFEYELRLAEAEGALHSFRRIFQRPTEKP